MHTAYSCRSPPPHPHPPAQGNVERARALFQEGVWADPSSRDTVYVLHAWGCLEAREGKLPLARELLKAAIRVDPKSEKVRVPAAHCSLHAAHGCLPQGRVRRTETQL